MTDTEAHAYAHTLTQSYSHTQMHKCTARNAPTQRRTLASTHKKKHAYVHSSRGAATRAKTHTSIANACTLTRKQASKHAGTHAQTHRHTPHQGNTQPLTFKNLVAVLTPHHGPLGSRCQMQTDFKPPKSRHDPRDLSQCLTPTRSRGNRTTEKKKRAGVQVGVQSGLPSVLLTLIQSQPPTRLTEDRRAFCELFHTHQPPRCFRNLIAATAGRPAPQSCSCVAPACFEKLSLQSKDFLSKDP